ncbi:nuclear transport factor 2 family protein [Daejeonella oryzae]|uniref:nuclear transport factor 2 family protein n=1 Tax=Daejeonella oryzae TaxID=1122943 RepID=UPI00040CB351|nr:nuclear transport factor 2 family protein [Daejeonella oryzae]
MKIILTLAAILFSTGILSAQVKNSETESVKKVINQLFEGMRKGDSSMVSSTFSKGMIMQTISKRQGQINVVRYEPLNFLKSIATPHSEVYDERITFDEILIDAELASVWTSYKFYVGDKFSHCGVNSFQLVKQDNKWKIVYLIDTRRKENCD